MLLSAPDGSGFLDREEVATLAEKMNLALSEGELDEAMDTMDADGSGEIDFDEFAEWWVEHGEERSRWMQVRPSSFDNPKLTTILGHEWLTIKPDDMVSAREV
eukprot:SAG11_NODE_7967_length_1076_cov_1.552712_2_plen_103_part_00